MPDPCGPPPRVEAFQLPRKVSSDTSFSGTNTVLLRLRASPESEANSANSGTKAAADRRTSPDTSAVSSAYARSMSSGTALCNRLSSRSPHRAKKNNGDNGHPCRMPDVMGKGCPLVVPSLIFLALSW